MANILRKSITVGGRELIFETGRLAKQASGSVFMKYGDTAISVTATGSGQPREGIDFFPLTCDYEERMYAVGKIPGGFIKREGRPSEKAILSSRLMDRPIRPLFPKGYKNDVQVVALVMSVDQDYPSDVTAICGASAALHLSDIPFGYVVDKENGVNKIQNTGPIAAVIVGLIDGELIINPTLEQAGKSTMHLTVAGTKEGVLMVEAGAKEVPEDIMLNAIMFGHDEIKRIVNFIEEFRNEALTLKIAKAKPDVVFAGDVEITEGKIIIPKINDQLAKDVSDFLYPKMKEVIVGCVNDGKELIRDGEAKEGSLAIKRNRDKKLKEILNETVAHFSEIYADNIGSVKKVFDELEQDLVRKLVVGELIDEKVRIDGRALDKVRQISCEVATLPRTHGSGLFTRGQTQVMTVCTLGAVGEEQILDGLGVEDSKRYIHHYNFPPYSVGETRPMRGPGRREIGHGALAERALEPMIPSEEEFPYTIRMVSDVLESNGSTSMGSTCGCTLALMDAGVPIKAPVSGVAMGLIKEGDKVAVLTDIQGMEDHLGDMDFKVTGTKEGITALQMDMKISGVNKEILKQALAQAYDGRMFIMGEMLKVIDKPKAELSKYAPRIISFNIHPDKIRNVIGPGGKMIKKIIEETGVKIDIEDDGRVFIATSNPEMGDKARQIIDDLTADVEIGKIYMGKVVKIMDFGAFVEVLPGREGLVHISQLAENRVGKVSDVVAVGDEILVKVIKIDDQGKVNLSRKEALRAEENKNEEQ